MLVRVRSKDGNFRFELKPEDDVTVLFNKILETATGADPSSLALSDQPRGNEKLVSTLHGTLKSLGINHGDLLFASYSSLASSSAATEGATISNGQTPPVATTTTTTTTPGPSTTASTDTNTKALKPWQAVVEDDVDQYWENKDGKIARKRDPLRCKHGDKAMCDYCMPLEPFDQAHQSSNNIKHLSFHSYLRKLRSTNSASRTSSSYIPPLEPPSYKVAVPCTSGSHPPWPAGICTKCQPSAITLQSQPYRLVDHVEFSDPTILERFIEFWRLQGGNQRFGFLLGRYEAYEGVPMGIKAAVEAIHEPPQEGWEDGLQVGLPWEEEGKVQELAKKAGLQIVGMIYTDLKVDESSDEAKKSGKVLHKRHAQSFFMSSLEAVFSSHQQITRPNPTRASTTGHFSSKFVTVVVTGDPDGQITPVAYQMSDQAMGLVEADLVEASVEPGTVRVKLAEGKRYVPDVFYRYKNERGVDIKESAKPCFPTEYLLVNLTAGRPTEPHPAFISSHPFPIENRRGLHDQSLSRVLADLAKYASRLPEGYEYADLLNQDQQAGFGKGKGREKDIDAVRELTEWLSDWHLVYFLSTEEAGFGTLLGEEEISLLAQLSTKRDPSLLGQLFRSPAWQNFITIAKESSGVNDVPEPAPDVPPRDYPRDDQVDSDAFPSRPYPNPYAELGSGEAGAGAGGAEDMDIDPETAAAIRAASGEDEGAGGVGVGGDAGVVCPHCTFENAPGSTDCDVCGLPLR